MFQVSKTLRLPLESVTQTFAILAKRRAGKSYLASVLAEEMLDARQQVVAIDPTGGWWGLRSSADGRSPGYPIVVFGGEHGDLPLEESAGETIARAVVENGFSAVLDLSLFRKGQSIRFMIGFLEALYRLNRMPLHLFVDEADAFAPQGRQGFGDENRLLGAMEDIVRRGGIRGIGCTLITQRPAVINKNVLTQCENLFTLRLVHPKDISAIHEWVNVHADPDTATGMIKSLPSLAVGTAWLWSPGWLNSFQKFEVRRRRTFDSSATPKPGEKKREAKKLAAIDIAKLGEEIQRTAERAKADDPKALRARIAQLEKELAKRAEAPDKSAIEAAVAAAVKAALRDAQAALRQCWKHNSVGMIDAMSAAVGGIFGPDASGGFNPPAQRSAQAKPATAQGVPSRSSKSASDYALKYQQSGEAGSLPRMPREFLTALAQHSDGMAKGQLLTFTGYASSGSTSRCFADLVEQGLIESVGPSLVRITAEGRKKLGRVEPLPKGAELRRLRLEHPTLGVMERAVLSCLFDHYPESIGKGQILEATGYASSGSTSRAFAKLCRLGWAAPSGRGALKASDVFFED